MSQFFASLKAQPYQKLSHIHKELATAGCVCRRISIMTPPVICSISLLYHN
ncbi:hypothetical protein NC653_002171 [Populus alba x Populus x berolinensis]|uniref:Uncharacterized protein n=1 Tax=Populus alba x Populus x berolinensis TaxID=444605 RepID=A0AAD6RN02_9ROSI|nr:hypothetical protein NC653_002171 [Populus alba x Populus x berolinensis]